MKIRKTRIKKTTKANGSVQYVAEYKWGFWWKCFDDCWADLVVRGIWEEWHLNFVREDRNGINSEAEQKKLIDFYIARVKHVNACLIENEVVKVDCERYP